MISTGAFLGILLGAGLALWGLLDLAAHLLHRETFSQWVINTSKRTKVFAFCVLFIIVAGAALLILHFDLPEIIFERDAVNNTAALEVYDGQYILSVEYAAAWCGDADDCQEELNGKVYLVTDVGHGAAVVRKEGPRLIVPYNAATDLCKTEFAEAEFCEPNYVVRINQTTDPLRSQQWALDYIKADAAWGVINETTVKIAVIDTGAMCSHEDIKCASEYNAITNKSGPGAASDGNGHGTHTGSTVCGTGANGVGIAGALWRCDLRIYKFLDDNGAGGMLEGARAIDRAVTEGADVISASWGGRGNSATLAAAVKRAQSAGVIIVAAAGNDGTSNDEMPHYPSNLPEVVSVASIDETGTLSSFSNYGRQTVKIAAPGRRIIAAWNDGRYRSISGTSMATPYVAAVAAGIIAKTGGAKTVARAAETIRTLESSAQKTLLDKTAWGVLDFAAAVGAVVEPVCKVRACKKCVQKCKSNPDPCIKPKKCRRSCLDTNGCKRRCKKIGDNR